MQLNATDCNAVKRHLDRIIQALVFVRFGQELGTDSQAARMIHDVLELVASLPWKFF